jgi:hypothetical protein
VTKVWAENGVAGSTALTVITVIKHRKLGVFDDFLGNFTSQNTPLPVLQFTTRLECRDFD